MQLPCCLFSGGRILDELQPVDRLLGLVLASGVVWLRLGRENAPAGRRRASAEYRLAGLMQAGHPVKSHV
jgi:hypothetical protein